MFIREITKKQRRTGKVCIYHQLTEPVRTPGEPRQNRVFNPGRFDLPKEQWKRPVKRIEEIPVCRAGFWNLDPRVEGLAREFASRIQASSGAQ